MPNPKPGLSLQLDQIPQVDRRIPVLRSEPVVEAAGEFVRAQTARLAPHAEVRALGTEGAFGVYDGERLIGLADPAGRQSHIVPLVDGLQPSASLRDQATEGARRLMAEQAALFGDHIDEVNAGDPISLMSSNITQRGTKTDPAAMLATVKFSRRIGGLPVFGPGSAASASYSANGLESFSHRWSSAKPTKDHIEAHAPKLIRDRLVEHVGDLAAEQAVKLHDATPAYYDDGNGTVQPVYRYRISTPSKDGKAAPAMYVGYIPMGDPVGDLPPLTPKVSVFPEDPAATKADAGRLHELSGIRTLRDALDRRVVDLGAGEIVHNLAGGTGGTGGAPEQSSICVGRYVVRQDNTGWVASANSFWDNLNAGALLGGSRTHFNNRQYYWAEPRLFLADKDAFINDVHLALTEVHGNWNLFTTFQNWGDVVRLSDVPHTGYGGDHLGCLAYWILHSCEVIPTSTDESSSYDVWWNIFNGLHAAMGYRTEMWINDQVSSLFGLLVGLGAPVVSSWLSTVINDNDYHPADSYYDGNRHMNEPMGRPSAIAVTGHGDDTVRMVSPLPKPSSLTEWWYDN